MRNNRRHSRIEKSIIVNSNDGKKYALTYICDLGGNQNRFNFEETIKILFLKRSLLPALDLNQNATILSKYYLGGINKNCPLKN